MIVINLDLILKDRRIAKGDGIFILKIPVIKLLNLIETTIKGLVSKYD